MKEWDVYLADVPFDDCPISKLRPVVILDHNNYTVGCLKMTSQPPRVGEYVLQKWKEAGLHKETTVRISKRLKLKRQNLKKQIGELHIIDIIEIQKHLFYKGNQSS